MAALSFLLCCFALLLALALGEAELPTYRAAVVEFSPVTSPPLANYQANLQAFQEFIVNASTQDVDIIVFPEIGLTGYGECFDEMYTLVPHPLAKVKPCDDAKNIYSPELRELSKSARDHSIYVVVNLVEKEMCRGGEPCRESGMHLYNTNVVFDRTGQVIARYRKFNLFGEDKNITPEPELSFFDTDFGVRFGVFTCFDLMFDRPANQLVQQLGIRDFVFPTAWFSELPFLTAVQAQQMWAYTHDVNFLGAGYSKPLVGSGGSSIYRRLMGAQKKIFLAPAGSEMLIDDLPIVPYEIPPTPPPTTTLPTTQSTTELADFQDSKSIPSLVVELKQENLRAYATAPLKNSSFVDPVCHGEFCCRINATYRPTRLMPDEPINYRAVAFDGVRTFTGVATGGIQACAIVSCLNETADSCGYRVDFPPVFEEILISGSFDVNSTLIMPSTVRKDLLPLMPDEFFFEKSCDSQKCNVTMIITDDTVDLLTFGVYARVYSRDGQPVSEPSSASFNMCLLSIVVSAVLGIFLFK